MLLYPDREAVLSRFLSNVAKTDNCWIWTGAKNDANGYGVLSVGKPSKKTFAHRLSYILFVGPIPAGMHILHQCDHPPCVNPAHLHAGTQKANMREMVERNRHCFGANRSRLLTEDDVRAILRSDDRDKQLASYYGISDAYVRRIRYGSLWSRLSQTPGISENVTKRRLLHGRGESHHSGKLTDAKVAAIRADTRSQRLIAEEYGIHQVTVSEIKTRKIWQHLP